MEDQEQQQSVPDAQLCQPPPAPDTSTPADGQAAAGVEPGTEQTVHNPDPDVTYPSHGSVPGDPDKRS